MEKRSESKDLSLLRDTEGPDNHYIKLFDDGAPINQEVYSIRHSHELFYDKSFGTVSNRGFCENLMDLNVELQKDQVIHDLSVTILLMNNTSIGPSEYGGPIFNSNGRLVGIVKDCLSETDQAIVISSGAIKEFLKD